MKNLYLIKVISIIFTFALISFSSLNAQTYCNAVINEVVEPITLVKFANIDNRTSNAHPSDLARENFLDTYALS